MQVDPASPWDRQQGICVHLEAAQYYVWQGVIPGGISPDRFITEEMGVLTPCL